MHTVTVTVTLTEPHTIEVECTTEPDWDADNDMHDAEPSHAGPGEQDVPLVPMQTRTAELRALAQMQVQRLDGAPVPSRSRLEIPSLDSQPFAILGT